MEGLVVILNMYSEILEQFVQPVVHLGKPQAVLHLDVPVPFLNMKLSMTLQCHKEG